MDLDARIAKLLGRAKKLDGTIYRSASPKYANSADLLSGEGSQKNGARWNPIGVAAVYGSFTPQTALEETLAHAKYYGIPVHTTMPRVFVAIEFALELVLNLTDGHNRQALALSEKRLLECDWRADIRSGKKAPITQQVGKAAANAGFEAILVRSAADQAGRNLVIFVDKLRSGSRLRLLKPQHL